MAKRLLIRKLIALFALARQQKWYHALLRLPYYIRVLLGGVLVIYGVIATFSPLPLGIITTIIGLSLIMGIRKVKYYVFRVVYALRIHIFFSKIYSWWRHR